VWLGCDYMGGDRRVWLLLDVGGGIVKMSGVEWYGRHVSW